MASPDWHRERHDWPLSDRSRFVERGGLRWHVQILGQGPPLLLLHGTGASTHSFRDLAPLLAERFTVIAPDLPGHAFSRTPPSFRPSLPAVAEAVADLLVGLELRPVVAVGHSAGAAIAARMTLDGALAPELLVGLGAAIVPFRGVTTALFAPAARLLSQSGLAAHLIAAQARDAANVDRMLRSTGSALDRRGVELYRRLGRSPGHVAGVLSMLACWDLEPLYAALPRLEPRLLLLAGAADRAVPVAQQREVAARAPRGRLRVVPGAGHLLHEEQPATVARLVLEELDGPAAPPA